MEYFIYLPFGKKCFIRCCIIGSWSVLVISRGCCCNQNSADARADQHSWQWQWSNNNNFSNRQFKQMDFVRRRLPSSGYRDFTVDKWVTFYNICASFNKCFDRDRVTQSEIRNKKNKERKKTWRRKCPALLCLPTILTKESPRCFLNFISGPIDKFTRIACESCV